LGGVDDDATEEDACFFPDFAADCFFDGLAGLDEACERGVPVFGPTFLTAQEEPFAVVAEDADDDGGVCAGEGEVGEGAAG
jgi:hypothetical protein